MSRMIKHLIEKFFPQELLHAKECAYHDAKHRNLLAFAANAVRKAELEIDRLKKEIDRLKKEMLQGDNVNEKTSQG